MNTQLNLFDSAHFCIYPKMGIRPGPGNTTFYCYCDCGRTGEEAETPLLAAENWKNLLKQT